MRGRIFGARSAPRDTGSQSRAWRDVKGRARDWLWLAVICASIALMLVGVLGWAFLLEGEREIRAANLVPPHRGASTTLAGMAIGLGLGGLILSAAALMPTRK